MKVYFVGAGPGNPELLTIKAHKLLTHCKICIFAGSLVSPEVMNLVPHNAEKHDSKDLSLDEMCEIFREAEGRGIDVVRLHSGDPSIYGAIGEQMRELDRMGIGYEVVPGVSSFQASAAALKTELTSPDVSQTIILTRTSGRTPLPEQQELKELARAQATLCIFLSTHKLRTVTEELIPHYGSDCPVGVVFRASWPDQRIFRGTLSTIADDPGLSGINKTAMIIVGWALQLPESSSKLYDAGFTHEYRLGTR